MKKIVILGLLLLSLSLLASCAPRYVCPDGSVAADPESCPKGQEQIIDPETPTLNTVVVELLTKSKNVESMSYEYKRLDRPLERPVNVWVKKLLVKQEVNVQTDIQKKNEMDTVIFDTGARTATAYCESVRFCLKTGEKGEVDYEQYYIKTPLDWIDGVTSAEKISEAVIDGRKVWQLRTPEGVDLWVDTFYGVPLRVDAEGVRYQFDNPLFNGVKDEEVGFVERDV